MHAGRAAERQKLGAQAKSTATLALNWKHMRTFVLRARAAPTDSQKLLASVGKGAHAEILAHTLMNAIFVAQSHRPDVVVYLVLESTEDFSRTIRFDANAMQDIGGFNEQALLGKVARALDASPGMGKESERDAYDVFLILGDGRTEIFSSYEAA